MSKIKQIPAYEQVYIYMRNAIKNKKWKVNEKIPSENELSNRFGVNRLTIRMAMQRLIGMGLLESRVGDGTYVKKFNFGEYINKVTDFYMTPDLLDKVQIFRVTIETACVDLAIENATDEEIAGLATICEEYEEIKKRYVESRSPEEFEKLVSKDVEFHYSFCCLSHNELFIYTFEMAREPIHQYIKYVLNKRIENWDERGLDVIAWNDMHQDIQATLAAKDGEACKKAVLDMVDRFVEL